MRNITLNNHTIARRHSRASQTQLRFSNLTVDAIDDIVPLLSMSRTRANDFSIGGLLMWTDYFHYEYCIYGETLFVKGVSEIHPELPAFSLPVGKMPLNHAVELIVSYCNENHIPLRFSAIPADRIDEFRAIIPGREEELNDWSDYIYDAEALATLSGKKFNKKRNHVNRFMTDNPDYCVEKLSDDNLGEVRDAYISWLVDSDIDAASATEESLQTLRVIDSFNRYPFEGILLRGNGGRVVAFTMGEIIGDTLYSHIEKIDHSVAGAGESINKLFADYIIRTYPQVKYINREEDAGDLGLRKAKESYHPVIKLGKFDVMV
ncbi:MAG: phosphatidylglycerol lysyltransferase domain-containing protein [Muribaculaceae bacterium]|nr:phosphatidylglycerol lysyltransferase domain-containing protein [Muribaculaceae bacterium]